MATPYGTCIRCGYRSSKAGLTTHFKTCLPKFWPVVNPPRRGVCGYGG